MAKYNGRQVQVTRATNTPEENFIVSSKDLGDLVVPKSKVIFTEEEKAIFLKEDKEWNAVTHESSYKTQAMEDKRIAEQKDKEMKNKYDEDRRRYNQMSAEEKAAYDKLPPSKDRPFVNNNLPQNNKDLSTGKYPTPVVPLSQPSSVVQPNINTLGQPYPVNQPKVSPPLSPKAN